METSRKDESMSQGVPKHRQAAWIHQGYLSCQPTLKRCMFQTLFTMNNETVAVWSHVAGLALTWLLRSHHRALPVRCGWERVVLEGYFASCAFLYLASAAYHCLKHHRSFAVYDAALAADLSGIVVVFATCASLLTATALHHASWLLAPALLLILWPSASALHRIWTTRDRASTVPTAHTAALFATGTIILTAAFLLGGQSRLATRLLHCILAFGVGALFYVSRVPERIFPGAFDILGSSHQLWHLCIVLGGWGFYGLCVQTVAAFMPHCAHTGQGPNVDLALLL